MKRIAVLVACMTLVPGYALACNASGFTVVYVNGVFTTRDQATDDTRALAKLIGTTVLGEGIEVVTGYNPMHLDGLGDMLESITQAFNAPISNFDLETILSDLASLLQTRKLLLVGHSQGSFYTNEIYDYLVQNGVPAGSVAVYNIATPAGEVAGHGGYVTSSNDKVINYVRQLDSQWDAPTALPPNVTVPQEVGYENSMWAGHIPEVYFGGAGERITSDIRTALARLATGNVSSGACIVPPPAGWQYDLEKTAFGIGDPLAVGIDQVTTNVAAATASALTIANTAAHTAISDAIFSVIPRPTAQNAAGVFAVEKALYGSSLSVADYEALLNGDDIPEVQPVPEYSSGEEQNEVPDHQASAPHKVVSVQVATSVTHTIQATAMTVEEIHSLASDTKTSSISELIPITPGFGGGGAAPTKESQEADADPETTIVPPSASSSDESSIVSATSIATSSTANATSTDVATSTDITSTATSTPNTSGTIGETSPVTDTFDTGFDGWNSYAAGWSTASWSTSTSDCYSGACLTETGSNQLYENIRTGTPLSSGTFVIYFRNHQFNGQFDVGVCTDLTPIGCENPASIGGTNALFFHLNGNYQDDAWHYLYFAFRDGQGSKEYCALVDDTRTSDCAWIASSAPNGTTYSGVFFSTDDGLKDGQSFYWDELGTSTHLAGAGVQ